MRIMPDMTHIPPGPPHIPCRVEYRMVRVEYGVVRVEYEKNQMRRHPRDKTHPPVAAPHIQLPRGVAEWNMRC